MRRPSAVGGGRTKPTRRRRAQGGRPLCSQALARCDGWSDAETRRRAIDVKRPRRRGVLDRALAARRCYTRTEREQMDTEVARHARGDHRVRRHGYAAVDAPPASLASVRDTQCPDIVDGWSAARSTSSTRVDRELLARVHRIG